MGRAEIIEAILGSRAKIKVLALLCQNPYREYRMGDIVKHTGLTYKTVSKILKDLKAQGIIRMRRCGPAKIVAMNTTNPLAIRIIRLFQVKI